MFWAELAVFLVMIAIFTAAHLMGKLPIGLSLMLASIAGILVAGMGISFSELVAHLVDGSFLYIDIIMIIAMAMVFLKVLVNSGVLDTVAREIIERFYKRPVILLILMMIIIMFPAMLTGSSIVSILSGGAIVAAILLNLGVPSINVAAIVGLGSIFGMIVGPINVMAMLIGSVIDMPYVGLEIPLALLGYPLAIISVLMLGLPYLRSIDIEDIRHKMPASFFSQHGLKMFFPIVIVLGLMAGIKIFPGKFPDFRIPVIFLLGSIVGLFTGERVNFLKSAREGLKEVDGLLGVLVGVGMFYQAMTLTGVRGALVITCLGVPTYVLFLTMALIMPLFGGISPYGAAIIFGGPFALAMLDKDTIVVVSALSLMAAAGSFTPPTAISAVFAVDVVNDQHGIVDKIASHYKLVKKLIPWIIVTILFSVLVVLGANYVAKLNFLQ